MPTVAHYRCMKCQQLITHEIVHVSEDLKHDAHLVKVFTARSLSVLKKNNVDIRKIIEFTDQAPSQYKNKTAFHNLCNSKIPIQENFFGVRHRKSSCDACTGRVKQGVTRLVQSEQEVVNDAGTFYETCVKHLEKPLVQSEDTCQHYMLTLEYHNKLGNRPSTLHLQGIPETCKLHQIGNTNSKALYYRKFECCCFGCIHGTEVCSNDICPSQWEGYDLAKKKSVELSLKFWFGDGTHNIPNIHNLPKTAQPRMATLNWPAILRALGQQRSFVQLQRYIRANPIPEIVCVASDNILQSDTNILDLVALHHIPEDTSSGFAPVQIEGDGNCLTCTISYLLSKTEDMHTEIRVCIIYEAVLNMGSYLDDNYVSNGANNFYDNGTLPEQYAQYSDNYNPHVAFSMLQLYKREVLDICKDCSFMGIWQVFQVANVIK